MLHHDYINSKSPPIINWTSISCSRYKKIHISEDLKWRSHISNIATMANSLTLGLLRQNLQTLSLSCKKTAYLSLIRPLFGNQFNNFGPRFAKRHGQCRKVRPKAARIITADCGTNYETKTAYHTFYSYITTGQTED